MKNSTVTLTALLLLFSILVAGCGKKESHRDSTLEQSKKEADVAAEREDISARGLRFEIPEGFELSREKTGLYIVSNDPEDGSCIYYEEGTGDQSMSLLDEDVLKEQLETVYKEVYQIQTEVTVNDFRRLQIGDCEALKMETEYVIDDIPVKKLEYVVMTGEKNYSLTYMQTGDADWWEGFLRSAETIEVQK